MQRRRLPGTEIDVSAVAMGCWAMSGGLTWGEQDESQAIAAISGCLDVGINLFDTAPAYGDGYSEELLGRALGVRRGEACIASKVGGSDVAFDRVIASAEASLKRLRTDRIDLLQIHWPSRDVPIDETLRAMEQLRRDGKVRALGVSNFGPTTLQAAAETGVRIVTNQLAYSLLSRAIEFEIQPVCNRDGVGILCYSPLAQGLLTGKFASADDVPAGRARTRHFSSDRPHTRHGEAGAEVETFAAIGRIAAIAHELAVPMTQLALSWCLHQPGVISVLAGARSPGQVRHNAESAALELAPSTLNALDQATQELKQALGPRADLWVGAGDCRIW